MQAESDGYAANCGIPDPSVDNPTYIIYNPSTNALSNDINFPLLANAWPVNLFPFLAILPYTGSVLVITGANVAAFTITSTGYATDTAWGTPINLPIPASYPQTATMVLLPLAAANNWAPQVSEREVPLKLPNRRFLPSLAATWNPTFHINSHGWQQKC